MFEWEVFEWKLFTLAVTQICGRNPEKQIDTAGFNETLQSFWVHHLPQWRDREEEPGRSVALCHMLPLRSAFLLICGSFVKNCLVLRDADNEHVSRCCRCCYRRRMWLLFYSTILINWSVWVQCDSWNKLPSIHKHKECLHSILCKNTPAHWALWKLFTQKNASGV